MAKRTLFSFAEKKRKKRPGIHAKSKTSRLKDSRNYVKPYNGQGK